MKNLLMKILKRQNIKVIKDDANTDVLAEEGALVNEDDYDLVDKKN